MIPPTMQNLFQPCTIPDWMCLESAKNSTLDLRRLQMYVRLARTHRKIPFAAEANTRLSAEVQQMQSEDEMRNLTNS
ncbi:hypothetical protein ACHAXS_014150 [Conticribra weissflogii]